MQTTCSALCCRSEETMLAQRRQRLVETCRCCTCHNLVVVIVVDVVVVVVVLAIAIWTKHASRRPITRTRIPADGAKVKQYTKAAKLEEKKAIRTLPRSQKRVTAANYAYSHSHMRLLCARSASQYFSKPPLRRLLVIFQIRSNPIYLGFATWITFEMRIPLPCPSKRLQRLQRLRSSHEAARHSVAVICLNIHWLTVSAYPRTPPTQSVWLSRQFDWT